ncbi:MAG: type II toxin-antitoxin system VapC family toxin [Verrucomicrobiales bacterium]
MTEQASILVDTNVILDVITLDPQWADWSQLQLGQYHDRMLINPMIYAELCYRAREPAEVDAIITVLGFQYRQLSRPALFFASQAYKAYRENGGQKSAPLPDFFIGAHAQELKIPILTRDIKRYRTYFPQVTLVSP